MGRRPNTTTSATSPINHANNNNHVSTDMPGLPPQYLQPLRRGIGVGSGIGVGKLATPSTSSSSTTATFDLSSHGSHPQSHLLDQGNPSGNRKNEEDTDAFVPDLNNINLNFDDVELENLESDILAIAEAVQRAEQAEQEEKERDADNIQSLQEEHTEPLAHERELVDSGVSNGVEHEDEHGEEHGEHGDHGEDEAIHLDDDGMDPALREIVKSLTNAQQTSNDNSGETTQHDLERVSLVGNQGSSNIHTSIPRLGTFGNIFPTEYSHTEDSHFLLPEPGQEVQDVPAEDDVDQQYKQPPNHLEGDSAEPDSADPTLEEDTHLDQETVASVHQVDNITVEDHPDISAQFESAAEHHPEDVEMEVGISAFEEYQQSGSSSVPPSNHTHTLDNHGEGSPTTDQTPEAISLNPGVKRGRGRPKGSRNKFKRNPPAPSSITLPDGSVPPSEGTPGIPTEDSIPPPSVDSSGDGTGTKFKRIRKPKEPKDPALPVGRPRKPRTPEENAKFEQRAADRKAGIKKSKGRPRLFPGYLVREMRLKKNRGEFNVLKREMMEKEREDVEMRERYGGDDGEENHGEGSQERGGDHAGQDGYGEEGRDSGEGGGYYDQENHGDGHDHQEAQNGDHGEHPDSVDYNEALRRHGGGEEDYDWEADQQTLLRVVGEAAHLPIHDEHGDHGEEAPSGMKSDTEMREVFGLNDVVQEGTTA